VSCICTVWMEMLHRFMVRKFICLCQFCCYRCACHDIHFVIDMSHIVWWLIKSSY
jgi:hypothetical protein